MKPHLRQSEAWVRKGGLRDSRRHQHHKYEGQNEKNVFEISAETFEMFCQVIHKRKVYFVGEVPYCLSVVFVFVGRKGSNG